MKRILLLALCCLSACLLAGCGDAENNPVVTPYPILFVTQVPPLDDDASRLSAFANHLPGVDQAPRGGDLMLRANDGTLRNLTQEVGLGNSGLQGTRGIAVREPAVHWNGNKALFSMLVGADTSGSERIFPRWQLYEIGPLTTGEAVQIKRLAGQPVDYNNVSPQYAPDGNVLFTSDLPANGQAHLYPQLDEYEGQASTTGLWSLNPETGDLRLLTQTPSGAFNPIVDSFGRIIFTRWDHLQQDRLAERDRNAVGNGVTLPFGSFNYSDEAPTATRQDSRAEQFPESIAGSTSPYGRVNAYSANFFGIWQINPDGSAEETLNHIGPQELSFGFLTPSFADDPNLSNRSQDSLHANTVAVRREGGLFHIREEPAHPGNYIATSARESDSFTTDRLVRLQGAPDLNAEQLVVTNITADNASDQLPGGRFRNPLPLSNGQLIASHTANETPPDAGMRLKDLRLRLLQRDTATGHYTAGPALTNGIRKSVSWWSAGRERVYDADLWELEAVEVRPRTPPPPRAPPLEPPEALVFADSGVDVAVFRTWMRKKGLALIVTRNQTSRDRADLQQPFNLQVRGGVQTLSKIAGAGKIYEIAHFQVFQANSVRAYDNRPGRRVLAQAIRATDLGNPSNGAGPLGSVAIAGDGSTAALVPASRALTWQSTDSQGNAVVRERNWITLQPGEIRSCPSCHGLNTVNQAGEPTPTNAPHALRTLLQHWTSRGGALSP